MIKYRDKLKIELAETKLELAQAVLAHLKGHVAFDVHDGRERVLKAKIYVLENIIEELRVKILHAEDSWGYPL